MFVITLQPVNKAGDGPESRLVIGDENPNPVKSIGAIRDPGNPKQVIVSWLPSDNTLKGTILGYEIGYGHARADERVLVKDTDSEVTVPGDKSVVVIVRVSPTAASRAGRSPIRVPLTDASKTTTTDQRIDLVDQDGVISVAATQSVASNNRLVVQDPPHREQRRLHRDAVLADRCPGHDLPQGSRGQLPRDRRERAPRDGPSLHQRRQGRHDERG